MERLLLLLVKEILNFCYRFFYIFFIGDRAMSPAQSEDSGLAADRGTSYATISLPRENASSMAIVFAGKFMKLFLKLGVAYFEQVWRETSIFTLVG